MLKLTVYKNLDPKQPISFTGRKRHTILAKLRKWMDDNNGDFCKRRGERPCGVDGLTIFNGDNEYDLPKLSSGITLIREENPDGCPDADWRIDHWLEHPSGDVATFNFSDYGYWKPALEDFANFADSWGGEWSE